MINMQQQLAALFSGDQDAMGKVLMGLGIGAGDVHIDRALSNLAVSYANEEYIADKVLPVLPVKNRSDKYFKFDTDMNFNVANAAMASQRGRPGEINYGLTTDNYSVSDYGLMDSIPFDVEANADAPLDIQSVAVETLTNFLMLAREIRVANLFVAGNFTGSTAALSGTNRWDDYTNSDPVKAIETVIDAPLVRPNTMICGIKTWKMLRQHPKVLQYIISRAATVNGAVPMRPTKQLFADAFELDAVYVPKPRYNNSNAVGSAFSLSNLAYVWPQDMCALIYVNPRPSPRQTNSFGYTFRFAPPGGNAMEVLSWFDRVPGTRGVTYLKVTHSDSEKLVAGANAGYLFTTCVS